jgi:hypothetical protein
MGWATFLATFSQTHLVTLLVMHQRVFKYVAVISRKAIFPKRLPFSLSPKKWNSPEMVDSWKSRT